MEIRLSETFAEDIDGESPVRALQALRDDKSACLVSMQRFRERLDGREGTFVLQGSEIVENGRIRATWFVVPGSGTGDLSGLRGDGGFEGDFGKGPKEPWIIGSNDVATISRPREEVSQDLPFYRLPWRLQLANSGGLDRLSRQQ
jgi:hypothetical protein